MENKKNVIKDLNFLSISNDSNYYITTAPPIIYIYTLFKTT